MDKHYDLNAKIAVVTGACGGIGRAISEVLAAQGATVYLIDLDRGKIDAACSELAGKGFSVRGLVCDIRDFQAVRAAADQIFSQSSRIDILINNAGILHTKSFAELSEEEWDMGIAVNLKGTFNWCKAVFDSMKAQRSGKIVNIASLAGKSGGISVSANYAVSKGGMIILTRCLAKELAADQVNVNCIAPGLTETPLNAVFSEAQIKTVKKSIPMGRAAQPREIADLVLFLCSPVSAYITGETININGGLLMD